MNRILFLDNIIDRNVSNPLKHFPPLMIYPFDVFHASAGELPSSLDPYSHIILTGSEASVFDEEDWQIEEQKLIRTAVEEGKVILGSCHGHQLIALSLFGKNAVRRRDKIEIGWEMEVLQSDPLLGEPGQIINTLILHYDEVCNLPEDKADVLARSSECDVLAFKVRHKPVWGIQPHPEIGIVESMKLIEDYGSDHLPDPKYYITTSRTLPKDSGWIVPLMREFQKIQPIG